MRHDRSVQARCRRASTALLILAETPEIDALLEQSRAQHEDDHGAASIHFPSDSADLIRIANVLSCIAWPGDYEPA